MTQKPKRPPSVWISQILLVIFGLLFIALTLISISVVAVANVPALYFVWVLFNLGLGIGFFVAFWGLMKRRRYGRWMAVGFLSLMFVGSVAGQIARPSGPLPYAEYENDTQRISGTITQVVISGLYLFLIFRLSFGKPASNFFSPLEEPEAMLQPPPPPPTFNEQLNDQA